jgi:glycosyltransferase involved in cell wall biosynthesis
MNILLWRTWIPTFDHPLSFSCLGRTGIGGTETQMLWHARQLTQMGHRIQVFGAARQDVVEEGVEFLGADGQGEQEKLIHTGRVREPEVIFLEGGFHAAPVFRRLYPRAKIVHVGQNIDAGADRAAFALARWIDVYAFVSPGHLADYCARYWRLRPKFMLLRNCVPWHWLYKDIEPRPVEDSVAWVGGWTKKGLRQWAEVMQRILGEFPGYRWRLFGPRYSAGRHEIPPWVFRGLRLPSDRIEVGSLPLGELARGISAARVVLVSLGNETAGISALDAHAMGRPTLSGNDMVYQATNPNGTGVRVSTRRQCYEALRHLLGNPALCDAMGSCGRAVVLRRFTEEHQRGDLQEILEYLGMRDRLGPLAEYPGTSHRAERLRDLGYKLKRKWLMICAGRRG